MEPAEVPGVGGGKWTDQETLLLLEAIELYKENWNEIAEHVATKSKAQCLLHFVQMPIEDAFVDCGDDNVDAICQKTADPATTSNDSSVHKDASEFVENEISDSIEGHVLTNETSKADDDNKVNLKAPKLEDIGSEKTCEGISKSEYGVKVKSGQEACNNYTLNALDEAFVALGYSPGPEGPSSFAEVGNPVMVLALFLVRLVGSDGAVASATSAHSSLKSMSVDSPSTELAARHCFILEDPPDDKESTSSKRDSKKEEDQDDRNVKQDRSVSDDIALTNDHNDKKIEDNDLEDLRSLTSPDDGVSEKPIALKEQAKVNLEDVGLANCNDPGNSEIPNDQVPSTVSDSDGSKTPPSSEELRKGTLVKEPCQAAEELKNGHVSDTRPLDNNPLQQSIKSNLAEEHPQHVETPKDACLEPDSMSSDKSEPQKLQSISSVGKSMETTDSVMEVDMVSNSLATEINGSR